MMTMLERLFKLRAHGTTVQTEIIAGATTYLSMAYIIFVQPAVLSLAGMDFGSVMMATCISSAIACLAMAFFANYPIALAPGMGLNFYFVFTVVLGMGIEWQTALGAVFISGAVFFILSVFRIRKLIIDAIPPSLKSAIPAAIGIFITLIGLVQAGIVIKGFRRRYSHTRQSACPADPVVACRIGDHPASPGEKCPWCIADRYALYSGYRSFHWRCELSGYH